MQYTTDTGGGGGAEFWWNHVSIYNYKCEVIGGYDGNLGIGGPLTSKLP